MKIESTSFGSITVKGETYEHDIVIRMDGSIKKRKKRLSKELYGTSHILSLAEAEFVYEKGAEIIIIGSGQNGMLRLSEEAEEFFEKKGCDVVLMRTPEAIKRFNKTKEKKIGLFHVTC